MNLCRSCGQDFSSVAAFDKHRVGVHAYTYSEGAAMDPIREDGRRCLNPDEYAAAGLALDPRGRWQLAERAAKVRAYFDKGGTGEQVAAGRPQTAEDDD